MQLLGSTTLLPLKVRTSHYISYRHIDGFGLSTDSVTGALHNPAHTGDRPWTRRPRILLSVCSHLQTVEQTTVCIS